MRVDNFPILKEHDYVLQTNHNDNKLILIFGLNVISLVDNEFRGKNHSVVAVWRIRGTYSFMFWINNPPEHVTIQNDYDDIILDDDGY